VQYSRCKCGWYQALGSMPQPRCARCPKCGSDIAPGPNSHRDPVAHDFSLVAQVDTDEGLKPLSRCLHCGRSRREITDDDARAAAAIATEPPPAPPAEGG
jgi:uncharacterized protein with PIN domain